MKEKLLLLLNKIKELAEKLYPMSPFLFGLGLGYFGRPVLQPMLQLLFSLIKLLFKL